MTLSSRNNKKVKSWYLIIFALPFAGIGLGFLFFSVIPSIYEAHQMQQWQLVPGQLLNAKLQTNRGDDGATYQAVASYRYYFRNLPYESDRVGIMSGSDNIGSWQEDKAHELKRALAKGGEISVYVNPDQPQEAVIYRDLRWGMLGFKLIFVIVFGGVGVGLIAFQIFNGKKTSSNVDVDIPPWLRNASWHNPVSSNARAGMWFVWIFAIFWSAISSPIPFIIPKEIEQGNYLVLIALLFPIIGVGLLVWAVSKTREWLRFGAVQLLLNPYPGAIGGHIGGEIELALPYQQGLKFSVTLACLHSYYSGSGKDRSKRESVEWQKDGIAQVGPGPKGSRLTFNFNVPKNLPASQEADDSYYLWRVSITADLPGADFDRDFEIPAFPSDAKSTLPISDSSQHPQASLERGALLEQLLNARQIEGGVALHYGYFRNGWMNLGGIVFGLIFLGAGVFMWFADAPLLFPIVFAPIGALITWHFIFQTFNAYHVKLGSRGIYTERYFCGLLVNKKHILPEAIKYLAIESKGSSHVGKKVTEHFIINAVLNDGSKHSVVESLNGRSMAEEALESVSLLSGFSAKK